MLVFSTRYKPYIGIILSFIKPEAAQKTGTEDKEWKQTLSYVFPSFSIFRIYSDTRSLEQGYRKLKQTSRLWSRSSRRMCGLNAIFNKLQLQLIGMGTSYWQMLFLNLMSHQYQQSGTNLYSNKTPLRVTRTFLTSHILLNIKRHR